MKKFHKWIMVGMVVLALGATSVVALAASPYDTPAEAIAAITGRTEEDVREERAETGKTYGAIAIEAGKQEEFKDAMTEMREDALVTKVEEGQLTQEEADAILARIQERQAECDGTGSGQLNRENLGLFGQGKGDGQGAGQGGQRKGAGDGTGAGLRDGSCNAG
ncbi:MAG: hypothetical protein PHP22_09100 [Oscillospiraceae bacterium]|jgi:hypothetical protein|nr:hypothetical protein [Oscillospiraceae bacterium]